jgi:vacuolar-type H+-ATPase subunit H
MAEQALGKLLAAEREANEVLVAARKRRAALLKEGREAALAEVAHERTCAEQAFQELLTRYDSELEARVADLEEEHQAALKAATLGAEQRQAVSAALLEATLSVQLVAPDRPLSPFPKLDAVVMEEPDMATEPDSAPEEVEPNEDGDSEATGEPDGEEVSSEPSIEVGTAKKGKKKKKGKK